MDLEKKPVAAASPSLKIDLSTLEAMSGGNKQFIHDMITLFLEDIPTSVNKINAALFVKDFKVISQQAHKIKPNMGIMGLGDLQNKAERLEDLANTKQLSELLEQSVKEFSKELLDYCDTLNIHRKTF